MKKDCYMRLTTQKLGGIQECCRHSSDWLNSFISLKCIEKSTTMSSAVRYAKK